jgi:hypothetical protein
VAPRAGARPLPTVQSQGSPGFAGDLDFTFAPVEEIVVSQPASPTPAPFIPMPFVPQVLAPAMPLSGQPAFHGPTAVGAPHTDTGGGFADAYISGGSDGGALGGMRARTSSAPIAIPAKARSRVSSWRQPQQDGPGSEGNAPSTFPQAGCAHGMPPITLSPLGTAATFGRDPMFFDNAAQGDSTLNPGKPPEVILQRTRRRLQLRAEQVTFNSGDED